MSDKKETFGGELGKNLPIKEIYNDVAHPALSTIGQTLQGATRVALAPISAMIIFVAQNFSGQANHQQLHLRRVLTTILKG